MIDTSRLTSGFDVELNLGSRWFLTALNLLNDNGLLAPPGLPLHILDVQITADPAWHLEISIAEFPVPALARATISADGSRIDAAVGGQVKRVGEHQRREPAS